MLKSFKQKLSRASSATEETLNSSASLFGPDSRYAKSSNSSSNRANDPIATVTRQPSSKLKFRGRRKQRQNVRPEINIAELTSRVEHLSVFDHCIQVADDMASRDYAHDNGANSESSSSNNDNNNWDQDLPSIRRDKATGLVDCSILVSPSGNLLLMPDNDDRANLKKQTTNGSTSDTAGSGTDNDTHTNNDDISDTPTSFAQLRLHGCDDYDTSVYVGYDLTTKGDAALNKLSARGWSLPAATHALEQSALSLQHIQQFTENLILNKKEAAIHQSRACDHLRTNVPALGGVAPCAGSNGSSSSSSNLGSNDSQASLNSAWTIVDPKAHEFDNNSSLNSTRVGPLLCPQSRLLGALTCVEHYYASTAESDAQRWRKAAPLSILQNAIDHVQTKSAQRQGALNELVHRARILEEHLQYLKQERVQHWQAVYAAEEAVNKKVSDLLRERSHQREQNHLRELQRAESQDTIGDSKASAATSEEFWNMVSSVAESFENGSSFEPLDLPVTPSKSEGNLDENKSISDDETTLSQENLFHDDANSVPLASREQIEDELNLPGLRQAAISADNAVEDAAGSLLNVLSNLDTTRRSARIVTETCLLTAGKAQWKCLQSMIELERASLEERLKSLAEVEAVLKSVDMDGIRQDIDRYIVNDKLERGGTSYLGDDDDGGIASALAVLSSHVESVANSESVTNTHNGSPTRHGNSTGSSREIINESVDLLFASESELKTALSLSPEDGIKEEVRNAADRLCQMAEDTSAASRSRRSTICFALNSKRSSHTNIPTTVRFDALCQLFNALLSGCISEDRGVSNAKMCMMLAQTFFIVIDEHSSAVEGKANSSVQKSREKRLYIKNKLCNHVIWDKDDFWDEALSQQISESLTHSGVMSNFERQKRAQSSKSRRQIEWEKSHRTKWHDLNYTERIEAASQVHAVVFAQLSALAHSMLEFGCGLERSCAFVRRMAIRNQLPSSQRTILLKHLIDRNHIENNEKSENGKKHQNGAIGRRSGQVDNIVSHSLPKPSVTANIHMTEEEGLKLQLND